MYCSSLKSVELQVHLEEVCSFGLGQGAEPIEMADINDTALYECAREFAHAWVYARQEIPDGGFAAAGASGLDVRGYCRG